jgi:hypothetical protein
MPMALGVGGPVEHIAANRAQIEFLLLAALRMV